MAPNLRLPSPMTGGAHFARAPQAQIERSTFDRSHAIKTTFDAGLLVPILIDEVLPGDTFNVSLTCLARLTTQVKPVMDNLYLDVFFFAVPLRLLWTNWQKFNGEQIQPGDSTAFTLPESTVPAAGYSLGSLEDYMGIPISTSCTARTWWHTCLPIRAYYMIYNQWFRDENLCPSVNQVGATGTMVLGDGPDVPAAGGCTVKKRGKRHDYFTSALPWPQKGTAVSIPLGTTANVFVGAGTTAIGVGVTQAASGTPKFLNDAGASNIQATASTGGTPLQVDLTNATAATINSLRQAFQIQKMLERDARGGTRYTEIVKSHFGVSSPDARLQRPEYLGGGTLPINVAPVVQQTQSGLTGGTTKMGDLSGMAAAIGGGIGFTKSFTEHCYILGIANVRADLTYSQGLERFWTRGTRYDFYWPALAHLGEQSVLRKEIWLENVLANNETVFGYQERYAEYRYKPSRLTNLFRVDAAGSLAVWHLSEDFASAPTLNQTFIEDQTSSIIGGRIAATNTEPDIFFDGWFKMICARPMPVFGIPGMMDHF